MFKTLLFDNDGILVNTEYLYFLANRDILASIGFTLTEPDYRSYFLQAGTGVWHLIEEQGVSPTEIGLLRQRRNDLYTSMIETEEILIDGVLEVMEELSTRYTVGVVTGSTRVHFDAIHARTGLTKYFKFVVTADDCSSTKPHPEPYLRGIRHSNHDSTLCLAIEDSERGLRAATAAGLCCWAIPTNLTRDGNFSNAEKVLSSISELKEILLGG